jgi:hypothetical protein
MLKEMREVYDDLLDLLDVLADQRKEAVAMRRNGDKDPFIQNDAARKAFDSLMKRRTTESVKDYWEWRLRGILEHLVAYRDMDWSAIWNHEDAKVIRRNLWEHTKDLLSRIEKMTDTGILEEMHRNQLHDPR